MPTASDVFVDTSGWAYYLCLMTTALLADKSAVGAVNRPLRLLAYH